VSRISGIWSAKSLALANYKRIFGVPRLICGYLENIVQLKSNSGSYGCDGTSSCMPYVFTNDSLHLAELYKFNTYFVIFVT